MMKQIERFLCMLAVILPTIVWAQDEVPTYEVYFDGNSGVAYEYLPQTDTARVAMGGLRHVQESEFVFWSQTYNYKNTIASDVVIPERISVDGKDHTVTTIGGLAFYKETNIQCVTIPKTVRYIEGWVFKGCTALTNIYLYANPKKFAWIGEDEYSKLKDELSENLYIHVLAAYKEYYMGKFPSIAGKFVGDLEGEVDPDFYQEEGVVSGTTGDLTWKLEPIGTLETSLGKRTEYRLTIDGSGYMPDYTSTGRNDDERRSVYDRPWDEYILGITEIVIGGDVLSIGMYAFCDSPVKKVNFPERLVTIQQYAFSNCTDLKSVHLPYALTNVWYSSFENNNISTLTIDGDNPYWEAPAGSNAIINKETHELVMGTPATVIPASVTSIAERAFSWLSHLTQFYIPDNVKTIGVNAFLLCSNLAELVIGRGVTDIKMNAFWYCNVLADVYCYANPNYLTWDGHDNNRFFLESNKATKFHVPSNYLDAWTTKFPDINATYVGDLDAIVTGGDGDVSGNGTTDAEDVVALMNYIAGKTAGISAEAADVNKDGKVDVADVVALINLIFGK